MLAASRRRAEMQMRTTRPILVLTVMFAVLAAVHVSAQQADVKSLAGKWIGWVSPTRGSNVPLQVDLKPDGSYTSTWGSTMGVGSVKMEGGKYVAEGQLVRGTGAAAAGTGKSELTLTRKEGKQVITGAGSDQ